MMVAIPQKIMATQLLRIHNTQRGKIRRNCTIHSQKSNFMAKKSFEHNFAIIIKHNAQWQTYVSAFVAPMD